MQENQQREEDIEQNSFLKMQSLEKILHPFTLYGRPSFQKHESNHQY
jgi:hypothetical protein